MKRQSLIYLILIILIGLTAFAYIKQQKQESFAIIPVQEKPSCEGANCAETKNQPDTPIVKTQKFSTPIVLKINETVAFSDGLDVTLSTINDSRCPKNVACVWQGELSALFKIKGGLLNTSSEEITLGTVMNKSVTKKGYVFALTNATEQTATISVSYAKQAPIVNGGCYMGGCSSQICSDQKDVVSTCEYTESYACYKKTSQCERQKDGQCGWTDTKELKACLNAAL